MSLLVLLAVSLPFAVVLARRPIARRMAIRYGTRRPLETVLLLVGCMLGTAVLTGSLIVGDTLSASLRAATGTQLGEVDEIVRPLDPHDAATVDERLQPLLAERAVDGVLPVTTAPAACATAGPTRRAEPHCQAVEVPFPAAQRFGQVPSGALAGPPPAPGHAAISADLARQLRLGPGDALDLVVRGVITRVRVDRVLPREGLGSLWTGPERTSPNAFVAPGFLAGSSIAEPAVLVSNTGGVFGGSRHSTEVATRIAHALGDVPAETRTIKAERLAAADSSGRMFSTMLAAVGVFIVLAGLLLVVNVFAMLADDRRSELGMLRALGARRGALVSAFAAEGWLDALVAAVLGVGVGVGLSRLVIIAIAPAFAGDRLADGIHLTFAADTSSVTLGLAAGVVVVVATVVVASVRISRLNVIAAIRQLPTARRHRAARLRLPVAVAAATFGTVAAAAGLVTRSAPLMLLGPLAIAGAIAAGGHRPSVRRQRWAAVVGVAWATAGFPAAVAARPHLGADPGPIAAVVYVLQGLVLVGLGIALVVSWQDRLAAMLRRVVGGRRALGLRLGLAHPTADRFRAAMTLAMYALVIFTLTFVTIFSGVMRTQVGSNLVGDADVVVRPNPGTAVTVGALASQRGVRRVAPVWSGQAGAVLDGQQLAVQVGTVDSAWTRVMHPRLVEGDFPDAARAYEALTTDPQSALVDPIAFMIGGGGGAGFMGGGSAPSMSRRPPRVGDTLALRGPSGATRTLRISGIVSNGFLSGTGVFVGRDVAAEVLGPRLELSQAFLTVQGSPARVASEIAGAHVLDGLESRPVSEIFQQLRGMMQQLVLVIQAYLALGLVVGVAGLAIVMVRAVRERRRHIGVLRALGFQPSTVRSSFMVESGVLAGEGALIGILAALFTARALLAGVGSGTPFGDLAFSVPVVALVVLLAGTLVVSLVATVAPAQAASRISPAAALRIAD